MNLHLQCAMLELFEATQVFVVLNNVISFYVLLKHNLRFLI